MSLFDILNSPDLRSAVDAFAGKAKSTASDIASSAPGGMGGLLGAGALGALIGSFASKSVLKDAALVGVGAVAWNFYQKWSSARAQQQAAPQPSFPAPSAPQSVQTAQSAQSVQGAPLDETAVLLLRAMIYTARADGHIDAAEQTRISRLVEQMFPNRDAAALTGSFMNEPINPSLLAAGVHSSEQAEDLYRLSCLIVDVDHFMERSYLDALAAALSLAPERRAALEEEAARAGQQLLNG